MKKIRYGILGCGEHALRSHAIPGKKFPELDLVAISDVRAESMDKFCQEFGGNPERLSEKDLFASNIDAIIIATPDEFHFDNLAMAIHCRKHVLIEKPLITHLGDIDGLNNLFKEAEEKKLVITSCHPRRFDPPFVWLKEKYANLQVQLGKTLSFNFDFSYHHPSAAWKKDRSLMLDHLNHEIDLVHFLYDMDSFEATLHYDAYDRYLVTGIRKGGIAMSFHGSRQLKSNQFLEWLTIRFERGELRLDTKTGMATIFDHELGKILETVCGATDYPLRFERVTRNFIDTINGKAKNYLTPDDLWINNWLGPKLLAEGKASFSW